MPACVGPELVLKNTISPTCGVETGFVAFQIEETVLGIEMPTLLNT